MTAPTPPSDGRLVAITGSSGLIGTALSEALRGRGDQVLHLVRRAPRPAADLPRGVREARWQPGSELDPDVLEGVTDAVNLAGAGLFEGRWTDKRRKELIGSRVGSTDTLARALAGLAGRPDREPPRLVSGSGIGVYGDQGNTVLSEDSPQAEGFVPDLVRDWEGATLPAEEAGVPVAHIRTGIVLSPRGGALGRLLPLVRAGLGGPLGGGRQYWPWITLHDHVRAMLFLLDRHDVTGAVNLTGPHPDTQTKVVRALASELHRPALLPAPTIAMKVVLGQASSEVLNSTRALPTRLTAAGFTFDHPDLKRAAAWVVEEMRWKR